MEPHTYEVKLTNVMRTKADITICGEDHPTFTCDLSYLLSGSRRPSVMLQSSSVSADDKPAILGAVELDLTSLSKPVYVCFGDPNTGNNAAVWEALEVTNKWLTKPFIFNMNVREEASPKQFAWNRTSEVKGKNPITSRMDWLHLKLVEVETEKVVATFTHHWVPGWKRGKFEIQQHYGSKEWDQNVVLTGMGVIEYLRKVSGWSW